MKRRQASHNDQFSVLSHGLGRHLRAVGQVLLAFWAGALLSDPLLAAINPEGGPVHRPALTLWTVAQTTAPPAATGTTGAGEAVVPPVRREAPTATPPAAAPVQPAPAKKPDTAPASAPPAPTASKVPVTPPPPEFTGVFGTIQEWLARANREYQGVVVKELSLPGGQPAAQDDAIAKKLKEQQAEDAQKAAAAKRAEDAARQAAENRAAAAAKATEAKKLDEDRRRAEETKRLADEAKKKADELLKAEQPALKTEPTPDVAAPAPAAAPQPNPDDAARIAEQQRLEAQKLADEAKRQEQLRKEQAAREAEKARAADAQRKADDERKRAEAAKPAASAGAPFAKQTTRTIVLTPEPLPAPIARPVDPGTSFRPDMAGRTRSLRSAASEPESDSRAQIVPQRRRIRVYHEATYRGISPDAYRSAHRGTAVKRWVWRAGACSAAGRRVTPPARYTIKRGDSLWRISERHYHEGRLYPKIHSANRATIADPDLIYPCQRVLVPRKH